jgi:Glu-tRNA(Gln) amidotransferase subunit E-like FAD-binding protein
MKLFEILKKIFNVEKVDEINEEMISTYYDSLEGKNEQVEEVIENAEPVEEEKTEEVIEETTTEEPIEEKVEEVVVEVVEEPVEETITTEEEKTEEEVLTKDVIKNAKTSQTIDKEYLMSLRGKQFFDTLYKNPQLLK